MDKVDKEKAEKIKKMFKDKQKKTESRERELVKKKK